MTNLAGDENGPASEDFAQNGPALTGVPQNGPALTDIPPILVCQVGPILLRHWVDCPCGSGYAEDNCPYR